MTDDRPPLRRSTVVRSDVAHTFSVFVDTIASWWPVRPYSIGQDRVVDVVFPKELGGRIREVWDDGHTVTWGHVLAWDPPNRFAMTWEVLATTTEVEIVFQPLGPALTRVEVEHRGWERLPLEEMAAVREMGYEAGWAAIVAAFTAAADTASV